MTLTALMVGVGACALLVLGLALGFELFWFTAAVVLLVFFYCALSVLLARRRLKISLTANTEETLRGATVSLVLGLSRPPLLPVGPLTVTCLWADRTEVRRLQPRLFRPVSAAWNAPALHVGAYPVEVREASLTDCFGMFRMRIPTEASGSLLVLPRPFEIENLTFAQSEDAQTALKRASEDLTLPDDIRAWQPGDPMKRVHWKLTARKRELLVRRYETPMPKDTLILTDCAKIPAQPAPDQALRLRDALCETVVAVAEMQLRDGSPVRVPLYGDTPTEFSAERSQSLLLLQELLAAQPFRSDEPFARVLRQELRRVRRSGAVVIVSPRLNADLTDLALSFRRMGPNVRYYLVTFEAEQPQWLPFIRRMQSAAVEVCYVTPAS